MKKTFITCLALLAISLCLFVSCSAENTAVNEMNDVAYVTFGRDSRDFSASYLVQSYDELYWFYTAKKADNYGTTGATTGLTKAPSKGNGKGIGSGTVGPFSQGKWTFTLSAYASLNGNTPDESTCVYESKEIIVTLKGGETKAIPVTVSPVGETGLIKFKDAYFQYKDGGEEASKFMIRAVGKSATYELSNDEDYITSHDGTIRIRLTKNGNEYIIAFVEQDGKLSDSISTPVDYYTCTAYAYLAESTTPLATCTFGLSVYGNATTVVSGPLTENPDSKVSFDVAASDIKTFLGSNTEKKVEVKVAPVSGQSTTVDFNNANNIDKNATYAVNVEALSANAANDAFQFSNITEKGKETLGSVKLSLTQIKDGIATDVNKFGSGTDEYVTVSTYIDTGLTGDISVVYNGIGDAPIFTGEGLGYDSKTGIITFRTNHFSEFFIVRDGNVYNKNQNRYYYSLEDAINKANTNEQLVLMNNTSLNSDLTIEKSIEIDLSQKTLTIKQVVLPESKFPYEVIFTNGNITGEGKNAFTTYQNSTLGFDNIKIDYKGNVENDTNTVVYIYQGSHPSYLDINNSTISISSPLYSLAISSNAKKGTDMIYVDINESEITAKANNGEDSTGILINVPSVVEINKSNISGQRQGAIIRGGNATISNSKITSSGLETEFTDYTNSNWKGGNEVPLAALVIGNRTDNSYRYPTTVTIDNVTLSTTDENRKLMYVYQNEGAPEVTVSGTLKDLYDSNAKENKRIFFNDASSIKSLGLFNLAANKENTEGKTVTINLGDESFKDIAYSEHSTGYTAKGLLIGNTSLNSYNAEQDKNRKEFNLIIEDGSITSSSTGYSSIDDFKNTSVYMLLPNINTNVTFKNVVFNGVFSYDVQIYTGPWSSLKSIKFEDSTFNGIIVGYSPADENTFIRCKFENYKNETDANNSNPIWWRANRGSWDEGGLQSTSLKKFIFIENHVKGTRPVKIERIGMAMSNLDFTPEIKILDNKFDISSQPGDTGTKNMAINIGQYDGASYYHLYDDGNTISTNTASLYTAALNSGSNQWVEVKGTKIMDRNGNDKTITALVWKTTTNETFEMKSIQ